MSHQRPMYSDLYYPGHGYPGQVEDLRVPPPGARSGEHGPLTSWERLVRGKPLGKRIVVPFRQTDGTVFAPVSVLQLEGKDEDAIQINVTLSPPKIVPLSLAQVESVTSGDIQRATGELTNDQVRALVGNFPGSANPFRWTNISAIVQWGIGGVSEQAEVDLMQGLCVNLCASFVRVYAVVGDDGSLVGDDAAYVMSAFVGPGYPKMLGAQRTFYVGELDNTVESNAFAIPKFAKRVTLIGGNDVADPAPQITAGTIRFWSSIDLSGNGRVCLGNVFFSGNMPQSVVIPGGAAYFSILGGTAAATDYGAIFDLAI